MAKEVAGTQLTRMLSIVRYMESRFEAPVSELAAVFGCTPANIRSDIRRLALLEPIRGEVSTTVALDYDLEALEEEDMVVVASSHPDQQYRQYRLSAFEAFTLITALDAITQADAAPSEAASLLAKLQEVTSSAAASSPFSVTGAADTASAASADTANAATIRLAIEQQKRLRLQYVNARDERSERVVDPHELLVMDGVSYLRAYCYKVEAYVTLKLSRIQNVDLLAESVATKPSTADAFDLSRGEVVTIVVDQAARWAFESFPGVSITIDGEHVVVTLRVINPDVVATRLVQIAEHVISVSSPEVRQRALETAQAVVAAHQR